MFWVARQLTRSGLRILCYHGFELADESSFHPKLFISLATLRKRLKFLSKHCFRVLRLADALDLLEHDKLPTGATVITIDDGFFGSHTEALALLRQYSFPATVYVTSYYSEEGGPVFRLCVQYMFWKTRKQTLDGRALGLGDSTDIPIVQKAQKKRAVWELIHHGETHCDEAGRRALLKVLGEELGIDYDEIISKRMLSIVGSEEIRRMRAAGLDIQLHTHRHRFPEDEGLAIREIQDNRAALEPLTGDALEHFCYPSGLWSDKQWAWLKAAGIKTATTCEPGLNYAATPRLALKRFLDGQDIAQIEFEAEVSGFGTLLRQARSRVRRALGLHRDADRVPAYL
jgi:peptidoglycan/xylan/chitin deacetylase (PgdA/CDA1 family)